MARHLKLALRSAVVLLVATGVTGCGRDIHSDPNLESFVAAEKAKQPPPPDPIPPMKKFENFVYNDQGLRDPFAPPADASDKPKGPRPDPHTPQPLEAFPLDGLVMNGTLGAGPGIVGLVMSPDKVTHRVAVGNYLGQNNGKVTQVTETKISVTELVPDGAGGWIERPASIALPTQ